MARLSMGEKLIEESRRYGFYKLYQPEFEFAFSKLYYMNTLFTYMLGVKEPKLAFLREMKDGIQQRFPDFQKMVITRMHLIKNKRSLLRYI